MSTILRVYPTKFHENFHTSESHENYYNDVLGHDDHESGSSFVINIIFGFLIFCLENSTRIEVEHYYSHFTQ